MPASYRPGESLCRTVLPPNQPDRKVMLFFSSRTAFANQAICASRVSVSKWKRRPDFSSVSVSDRSATAHDA